MLVNKQCRKAKRGFTLIEVLVATLLLIGSLAVVVNLWSTARSITEKTRNSAEFYVVARQEVERFRGIGYTNIFNEPRANTTDPYTYYNPNTGTSTWPTQYYQQDGTLVASTGNYFYTVASVFSTVQTNNEDNARRLGVQRITVTARDGSGTFTTTCFYYPDKL